MEGYEDCEGGGGGEEEEEGEEDEEVDLLFQPGGNRAIIYREKKKVEWAIGDNNMDCGLMASWRNATYYTNALYIEAEWG